MVAERPAGVRRARRHLLVAGFVLAYLAAGGVVLALGERVVGGGWLALHLVLLGAATNAIVVWSEHFAAALLAGMGLGLWLAGGVTGSADSHRALRLVHVHLNVLGWPGWPPTAPGWASRWSPSSAPPCGGHRTRRRPGCSGPAWPGS
jgi:hypothetical protein